MPPHFPVGRLRKLTANCKGSAEEAITPLTAVSICVMGVPVCWRHTSTLLHKVWRCVPALTTAVTAPLPVPCAEGVSV